jgi:hypothetical protein
MFYPKQPKRKIFQPVAFALTELQMCDATNPLQFDAHYWVANAAFPSWHGPSPRDDSLGIYPCNDRSVSPVGMMERWKQIFWKNSIVPTGLEIGHI